MSSKVLLKTELAPFVKRGKKITSFAVGIIILLLFLPWEQTTKGEGRLIALDPSERNYPILAPISGYIKEYNIQENRLIKKGDLLFEMVDLDTQYLDKLKGITSDINSQYNNTQNSIELILRQRDNLEDNLKTGLEIYDNKISQIGDTLDALKNKLQSEISHLDTSHKNLERIKALFESGLESKRNYEVANNEYIKQDNSVSNIRLAIQKEQKALEIQKQQKKTFLKDQQNKINQINNTLLTQKNSLENFKKEMKNASINLSRSSTAKVFATKDGYPLQVLKNDRDHFIKQGEPILNFAPVVSRRVVRLKVRAIDMPLVKKNLKVRIQFYGWPSLQVSGWPKINYGTFGGFIQSVDSIAHEDSHFYAYITEDPTDPWPDIDILKVGTKATVWIRLANVSIWYELWRLHNAMPMNMVHPDKK